jgi:primosomal protein N' (replication factor Y)
MFIRVAINIPTDKTFIYSVPKEFEREIATGKRVLVPFGKRRVTGYILESMDVADVEGTKDIIEILDMEPLFNENDLNFYKWASEYYMYHLGKSLGSILPGGINIESYLWVSLAGEGIKDEAGRSLSSVQQEIFETLKSYPEGLPLDKLKKVLGVKQVYRDLKVLQNAKFITMEDKLKKPEIKTKKEKVITLYSDNLSGVKLTGKQLKVVDYLNRHGETSVPLLNREIKNVSAVIRSLEKKGVVSVSEREVYRRPGQGPDIGRDETGLILNKEQKAVVEKITRSITSGKFSPHLLHGVTGSGKTEVYLNVIKETLRLKGGVIFLVPEISLTPQLLYRFNRRFKDHEIAILHSGVSRSARYDQWRRIQRGEARIVVGARSAIFAPVRNLKLIIVDEEHDTSYKQDDRMRYNARDLAIVKAKLDSAAVVLGSATPGIQTYYNIKKRKYTYLSLPRRVEDKPLPQIEVVDMKDERDKKGRIPIISRPLRHAIEDTLRNKKQSLLFLNRRGFNTFMCCFDCGHVFKCLNCSVSMTHHAAAGTLRCHYCDYFTNGPFICPSCRGGKIKSYGVGTERVEEEISVLFPGARVERMDSDVTVKKGAYERLLKALDSGDIDILVGTQMITKGHDFPNITLVGVVSADTSLNIPDFRAGERTFQLMTQVSGRSGRGDTPGRVVVQTFNPQHYAIKRAKEHDYPGFYGDEISPRRELGYPPFSRMVNLRISGIKKERIEEDVKRIGVLAKKLSLDGNARGKVEVIGPAEPPISQIKGRYRWHILLKGKDIKALHTLARNILTKTKSDGIDIKVDADPVNFM